MSDADIIYEAELTAEQQTRAMRGETVEILKSVPNCKIKIHSVDNGIVRYSLLKDDPNDVVNHPAHYNSSKAICPSCERTIECIDITRHLNFNIGNAIKYLWRYELKNGKEDLKKAMWYIDDEIKK